MKTDEDLEAEEIFFKSILRIIDYDTAHYCYYDLKRRDKTSAQYLKFLLTNKEIYQFYFRFSL